MIGISKQDQVKSNRLKKPYSGKNRNRKGSLKKSSSTRNPLVLPKFYRYMKEKANSMGCDAHHWMPKSKLKQDIFLIPVPFDEHRNIHAVGSNQSPMEWAEYKGLDVLVNESMGYLEEWVISERLPSEYFVLIEDLRNNPFDAHDIARDFIRNNRGL